jgi:uncharacterized protein YbcC (UPF0753/DUF2309 family)
MVEIHEPIRNMTLIEAPLQRVKAIFDGHARLKNLLYNHWLRLAVYDPEEKCWYLFKENEFKKLEMEKEVIKHFSTSMDLIHRFHPQEDFAEIGK